MAPRDRLSVNSEVQSVIFTVPVVVSTVRHKVFAPALLRASACCQVCARGRRVRMPTVHPPVSRAWRRMNVVSLEYQRLYPASLPSTPRGPRASFRALDLHFHCQRARAERQSFQDRGRTATSCVTKARVPPSRPGPRQSSEAGRSQPLPPRWTRGQRTGCTWDACALQLARERSQNVRSWSVGVPMRICRAAS